MAAEEKRVLYYGTLLREHKKVELRAGPLNLLFENGDLRYIKFGEREIVRRVYFAVRDRNWNTVPTILEKVEVNQKEDNFFALLQSRNYSREVDFKWKGCIEGKSDGTIAYLTEGETLKDFCKNRIGLCVHLPMECAGLPCKYKRVKSAAGGVFSSTLPYWISPHQPFMDLKGFSYQSKPGTWVRLFFEGDIFEMEDQRNWSDASFKIYSTPLWLPFPVLVKKGKKIKQSLKICLENTVSSVFVSKPSTKKQSVIDLGKKENEVLCSLGFGFNENLDESKDFSQAIKRLCPSHLRSVVNLDDENWESKLASISESCNFHGLPLWLSLKTSTESLSPRLGDVLRDLKVIPERVMISKNLPPWNTTPKMVKSLRQKLKNIDKKVLVGGGTEAWFAELNRNRPPIDLVDFIFWSVTPQVHALDSSSLIENLAAQKVVVDSAFQFAKNIPLVVGPITLKMRFNPNATSPQKQNQPKELPPPHTDPRQWGLFAAVWTLISIKYLSKGRAFSGTYYELVGPRGIIYRKAPFEQPGFDGKQKRIFYPVFQVFKELCPKQGAKLYEATSDSPLSVDAIALESGQGLMLYVANLVSENQRIEIRNVSGENSFGEIRLSLFSEEDWDEIVSNLDYSFRLVERTSLQRESFEAVLPPYSICKVEFG